MCWCNGWGVFVFGRVGDGVMVGGRRVVARKGWGSVMGKCVGGSCVKGGVREVERRRC